MRRGGSKGLPQQMPLFQRKRKKADGEVDEVFVGSGAVTLIVLLVVALLITVLLLKGVDPTPLVRFIDNVRLR